jgi:hypothetical protein
MNAAESGIRRQKRDIVRRLAALGPAFVVAVVAPSCSREAPPTVVVPMIALGDDALDGGRAGDGGDDGGGIRSDAGVVELEPSPPGDAFACRRDVACRATSTAPKEPSPHLPSPFEHCPLHDDQGRAFSARETRDARLNDPSRCCYVSFVGCVRGAR